MILPGGFSPRNAITQFGSLINPTGGVGNYDVFTNVGKQRTPQAAPYQFPDASNFAGMIGNPQAVTLPSTTTNPSGPSGSGSGGSGMTAGQRSLLDQQFNTQLSGIRSKMGALPGYQDIAELGVQNAYQGNMNQLNTGRAQGVRNLDFSQNQVNMQKAQGLQDLADQIRNMSMGYNNQLGAMGAGSSSAGNMINFALAQSGAKNRAGVLQNASGQLQQIDMQRADLEESFRQGTEQLNQWKQQKMFDIAEQFASQREKLQAAMVNATGDRARALGEANQALFQSAIDALTNLQETVASNASNLLDRYRNAANPGFAVDDSLGQYEVDPINAGDVGGVPLAPVNTGFDPVAQILKRRDDDSLGV